MAHQNDPIRNDIEDQQHALTETSNSEEKEASQEQKGVLLKEEDSDSASLVTSTAGISYDEDEDKSSHRAKGSYCQIPYGFQSRGTYKHASKNCEIGGVTYNSRFRQFVMLDSRGITSWSHESVYNTVTRHLNYPAYQFNVMRLIIFSWKYNVYFALSKEYALKVFNINFHEVVSVSAEMHSVLCMVFNPVRSELITGGTGGMKFWTFGEVSTDRRRAWDRDSRPMSNYGLALRASYPKMGGSWVKQAEIDVAMQRLYCLSERNVVAYDMMGNQLFEIRDAHRGPVTGCVYSKSCNMLVTAGNDCDVNVWSRIGGRVHTFSSHTKVITKIMLHPETSGMVITASVDGMVKIFSLDIMEEIYSLPVFPEGIYWMECVTSKVFYCCSNRQIEVFALNHVFEFWALSRCSMRSLGLVSSAGKSSRVMAVGTDSSIRLISRQGKNLTTVLPPPPISPLTQVLDVTYNREFSMMYLLIEEQEIWVYYTRTNPATRLEAWQLDYIEDIHIKSSPEQSIKSRASTPWNADKGPSPRFGGSGPPSPRGPTPWEGAASLYRESSSHPQHERLSLTCLGVVYSPVIIGTVEGEACPDATNFLMAGTKDGRVLFLSMFCKGMKYAQLQAHKDLIFSVEHDQITNTIVTKCRSLNGINVQFWSLPHLVLIRQITCEEDITCSVRMGDILLCGHNSGYLRLHRLANDGCDVSKEEDKGAGAKRVPRDHHGPIISVDANHALEIFCSSSNDGFFKLWDKEKTLLREIALDDTLTAACFLNIRGDIVLGLKQQLFLISHKTVCPVKEYRSEFSDLNEALIDGDEAFETESDIYEDPSVRYEGKKILQPDPTNMENYLVPFPNLQLKASLFMEGRPPPDLGQQDQQEDLESISSMSDSLSLAPTDIYFSPQSTPRRLSLASIPALEQRLSQLEDERQSTIQLWDLPYFGDSPVSSPPRTPSPEPTPPPTPPPGSSDEEDEEDKVKDEKPSDAEQDPGCKQCKDPVKGGKDKKKTVNIPSFRREGGRMGNVRIDAKSLRGSGGPGYAAPVSRDNYARPEPKSHKPRRIPRTVVKKTKKSKNKAEEGKDEEETENKDSTAEGRDGTDKEGPSLVRKGVLDIPPDGKVGGVGSVAGDAGSIGMKARLQRDVQEATARRVAAGVSEGRGPGRDEPGQPDKKAAYSKGETSVVGQKQVEEGKDSQRSHQETQESGKNDVSKTKISQSEGGDREGGGDQLEQQGNTGEDGTAHVQDENNNAGGDASRDLDPGSTRVVYVDPETGDTVEGFYDEMPDGAEILQIIEGGDELDYEDDDDDDYDDDEPSSSPGRTSSDKRQKSVTFNEKFNGKITKKKWGSRTNPKGPNFSTNQKGMGHQGRGSVVPMGEPQLQGELITGAPPTNRDLSPLTIFALARSRKENAAKKSRRKGTNKNSNYSMYTVSDNKGVNGSHLFIESNQYEELVAERSASLQVETMRAHPRVSVSPTERPKSSKKSDNDVMGWCLQALKKTHRQMLFPPKPSRPGSSPSVRSDYNQSPKKDGDTLVIDMSTHARQRPRTADTIRTTGSKDEFEMYPYQATSKMEELTMPTRDQKEMRDARAKTAPTGRRASRTSDIDLEETYREMHSSIEAFGKYDYDVSARYRPQFVEGRPGSSMDFPSVEVEDYCGNWQDIVLQRAHLLKQQRLERQKSARQRRETIENDTKERRKKAGHMECSQDGNTKPEKTIEFINVPSTSPQPSPPAANDVIPRELREQELSAERPFRLRLQPRPGGATLSQAARSLISLKASEHDVADTAGALPKPVTPASIPAKCSRYVLITDKPRSKPPRATALEQSLLLARFPNEPLPTTRRHHRLTRPCSTPNVCLEYQSW